MFKKYVSQKWGDPEPHSPLRQPMSTFSQNPFPLCQPISEFAQTTLVFRVSFVNNVSLKNVSLLDCFKYPTNALEYKLKFQSNRLSSLSIIFKRVCNFGSSYLWNFQIKHRPKVDLIGFLST